MDVTKRPLQVLHAVNRVLLDSKDPGEALERTLALLAKELDLPRAMVSMMDRRTGRLRLAARVGISEREADLLDASGGDRMALQVVRDGAPVTVPRIGNSPVFSRRVRAANDRSIADRAFVCVPVRTGAGTLGALATDLHPSDPEQIAGISDLLSTVASMIAWSTGDRPTDPDERQRLIQENHQLKKELAERLRPGNIVGTSPQMREVYDILERVSPSDATVLIRGESGVGKELVAQAVHFGSPRAPGPFVRVNCAALPGDLLESELFGHEKGAFTGALKLRRGRFETAHGGTLFLDEIGDFPAHTQVVLLRFIQEREFERVGGNETLRSDVRIITATNRDLESLVAEGRFREDLYWRLNVYPIRVPPLRERPTDIPLLADHFAGVCGDRAQRPIRRITTAAIEMLTSYHWPGNVRELENAMERAVIECPDGVIDARHLPPTLQTAEATGATTPGQLAPAVARLERDMILDTLKQTRGNCAAAARILGITERQIGIRIERHGIDWRHFRRPSV